MSKVSDSVLREVLAQLPRPPARRRRAKNPGPPRKCTYALPADLADAEMHGPALTFLGLAPRAAAAAVPNLQKEFA